MKRHYYILRHKIALLIKTIPNLRRFIQWRTWREDSYYPEAERKSVVRIFIEQLLYLFKIGKVHVYYFAYGLDVKNWRNAKDYMDDEDFLWKCSLHNRLLANLDYTCILRDKALFEAVLTTWGYNTPRILYNSKKDNAEYIMTDLITNGRGVFLQTIQRTMWQGNF